ncbi:ATP-binding cassette sub- F member 3 [Ancistrocladus abbreviatus]
MVGPNGIGKSTILILIAGELQPSSGTVFRSAKVRIAVFSQHHVDGLDLSSNPLLYMMRCYPGVPEQKLRAHLGSLGITGNLAFQPMYTLSVYRWTGLRSLLDHRKCFGPFGQRQAGEINDITVVDYALAQASDLGGQKSRLAFVKITFRKPHLLLLDEPSNHLASPSFFPSLCIPDICIGVEDGKFTAVLLGTENCLSLGSDDLDAVEALIQGLIMFQGGILMVGHDEHLISGSVDELWVVSQGKVTPFDGTFQDYKKLLQSS